MSKQNFKVTLKYDSNYGETLTDTIYIIENNSTDFMIVLDEDAEFVECYGTDSYCYALSCALRLTSDSGVDWETIVEEICYNDLPEVIKQKYG